MAGNKIRGITIEIAGDTSKLSESLRKVDDSLKSTQKQLSDVNRLLKLDPKNTELLRQKQELLNKSLDESKKKVENLKATQAALGDRTADNAAQYDAIEREIVACESAQKKWKNELDGMTAPLKGFSDTMKDVSKTTGEWANKTKGISMAAGAAAGGLLANAFAASASADDYNTLARNTGFTVEELQKMKYASDFVDVSFDSMTGTITKLTKNMASGSDAFDTLGVSIRDDMTGELRDAHDVWYETLYALSKVENETEKDALAMTLFGKSAMDLSGIIDDGGVSLVDYGNEAERAGLILSGDTMEAANALNDQVDKLKATTTQAMLEAGAALAQTLAPAVEKVVGLITKLATWFGNLSGPAQAAVVAVLALVAAISPVLGIISAVTGAAAALNVAVLPMVGTIAAIVAGIALLVAAGVALYQNWDKVTETCKTLLDNIKKAFSNIQKSITTAVQNALKAVQNAFNNIKTAISNAVNNVLSTVTNVFNRVKSTIQSVLNAAVGVVSSAVSSIKSLFNFSLSLPAIGTSVLDTARSAVSGAVDAIRGFFNFSWSLPHVVTSAVDGLYGTVSGIVSRVKGLFNFSWSLPTLKVPHVTVDGGAAPWGIGGKGRLPSFDVRWYRKAYDNAVLFRNPTVLPTLGGLKGFGDGAGSEMVIGTNKLLEMMNRAGTTDIDINVYAAQGMSETAIADAVAVRLDRWLGERL